jgi:hypothetical protein
VSELATLETILSGGWPMRRGIVKMHHRSSETCTAPAVQDLRQWLEYFSQKYSPLMSPQSGSQSMKIAPWKLRNTVSVVFGAAIVRMTFVGTSSVGKDHIR